MSAVAVAASEEARRVLVLPDGRRLVVRPMVPADASGLDDLYDRLSNDDRYRRFFTSGHPTERFVATWAAVGERGGYGLVAAVEEDDTERLVAEAGYALMDNGNAEFALTVDTGWRGWLGPYLLDALVEAAAERGVPNLEAEILLENRPMLALVRHRGYAVARHDWSTMHVVIGTSSHTPGWPPQRSGPRVLVEIASGRWPAEAEARAAGLETIACPGPDPARGTQCPMLAGHSCPLALGADAIVVALADDDPRAVAIRAAHPKLHPHALVWVCDQTGAIRDATGATAAPACSPAAEVVARLAAALHARQEKLGSD